MDIKQLSEKELLEALKAKKQEKAQDREAYKRLIQQYLPTILTPLIRISEELKEVKAKTFKSFEQFLSLKADLYGIKEEQQSHTFTTDKGESITIGYNVIDAWDDTVNTGLAKINEYIKQLADNETHADTITIINQLLKRDSKGNLKSSRVLELISLADKLENDTFADGVKIIQEAYRPVRTSFFIKANYVNNLGQKCDVPLSISSVDFPADFDLTFLLPTYEKERKIDQ